MARLQHTTSLPPNKVATLESTIREYMNADALHPFSSSSGIVFHLLQ